MFGNGFRGSEIPSRPSLRGGLFNGGDQGSNAAHQDKMGNERLGVRRLECSGRCSWGW